MRIGIYIDNWEKQAGGGHAYANTLVEHFSDFTTKHEFVFIIATRSENTNIHSAMNRVVLYNPYDSVQFRQETDRRKKNINSLKRFVKICNLFIDRLGINSFTFIREKINNRINKIQEPQAKDPSVFKEMIKREGIQCVYYLAAFVCEDLDVPFYTTIWDLGHLSIGYFPEISNNGQFKMRQDFLNEAVHRAYKIVSESESGKSDICHYYRTNPQKVIVVPQFPSNLVNKQLTSKQVHETLEKYQITKGEFLFYPAQFWPHKNHINLIKALECLKKEGIIIKLVLTGSDQGNMQFVMDYLSQTSMVDQVIPIGFVSDDEMKALYLAAYALIFPSLLGQTNMPIVEAIACGCPVICSDFAGHREQAQNAALYFKPDDYLDIAEKIKVIIQDESLRNEIKKKGQILLSKRNFKGAFSDLLISFDEFEKIKCNWS